MGFTIDGFLARLHKITSLCLKPVAFFVVVVTEFHRLTMTDVELTMHIRLP